jgi:putative hemolysin
MGLAAVQVHAVPNPAAAYAEQLGYDYEATAAGETVTVAPGVELDAWDFYRGKVGSEYAYGARYGYDTVNRTEEVNGSVRSYAVCVPKAPLKTGGAEEVPLLDLMKQNGEPLWMDPERTIPEDLEEIMKTAPLKTFPKQELPSSWDWRNVSGSSYIGSVRNQGSCGSCYAFGAAAAAEGTFNYAMNRTGSQCVDFSEAYIAWCLGEYGPYSSHFSGCDGADYDYAELEALTVEGICGENQMPYNNGSDPKSCTYSGTTTVFEAWARVPYGDIDAIKTAIMTYGVVDAAVYVDNAFDSYDGGVHDDNNNTCSSGWYTTSNHAISLVGWDDNPPEGGGGVWILRNSWGTSWGESGYMRIRYDAAVVHCAVCYMVYGEVAETAPTFTSGTSFGATTGVARTHTVTASGNPAPALKLQSTTASAGYYTFITNTGVLTYQPPAVDAGSKTFTFTASNSLGVATQTVTATVTLAPPAAPAAIWASATNTTDFTAAWSSVADATGYRLDVGTNATFTGGGGGGGGSLDISGYDLLQFDSSQTYTIPEGTVIEPGGYVIIARNQDKAAFESQWGVTLAANVVFLNSGGSIPQLNGSETFLLRDASDVTVDGQTALAISGQVTVQRTDATADATSASSWTSTAAPANSTPGTGGVGNGTGGLVINEYSENGTYTYEFVELYYDAIGAPPSYVPGYSNKTVSGTSQSVTGLTAGATYYFRARAVNAGGSSPNTSVASVTTLATLSAPVFGANPGPIVATAGVDAEFTVGASGVPAPTLALDSTTAEPGSYDFDAGTGDVLYIAPQSDAGTKTFTFSAVNSQGSDSQVVTVNVAAATAPEFTGGAGPYSTTAGVEVAFTVTASGTAPTLALADTDATSGYSFTPATGAFTYTPPAGDVGTQTFTFTAANAAGTVTQVTSVVVSEVPTAPDAPASVWASGTNDTGFTAAWSASAGATSYRLDVGTNETFSAGGGSVNLMSNAGFESGDSTSWTKFETDYAVVSTDPQEGTYHVAITATSTRDLTQNVAITGDGTTEYEISYWYKGSGNARIWASWTTGGQVSGDNLQPGTYNPAASEWTKMTYTVVPQSGANILFYEIRTYNGASMNYDNFFVGAAGGGSTPSYLSGYSNRTVSGTSESVTGLAAESTYYFRVRAVNDVGTSGDSSVASVTTLAESAPGTPPVVDAIPAQVANVGGELEYTVTATATDGAPILSYGCTSAVDTNVWDFDTGDGYFVFYPMAAEAGTNLFNFTATDKDGVSAAVQMSVKVYSAAASNEFTQWVEDQEENPADPDFAEGADIDGDGQTTYEEYLADTDPAASNSVLRLEGQSADLSEFSFPASPARFYQFVYTADLSSTQTNDIGWGVPGMVVTSTVPGTWFGTIRVRLDEP